MGFQNSGKLEKFFKNLPPTVSPYERDKQSSTGRNMNQTGRIITKNSGKTTDEKPLPTHFQFQKYDFFFQCQKYSRKIPYELPTALSSPLPASFMGRAVGEDRIENAGFTRKPNSNFQQ